jgi:plastocyanin
MNYKNPPKYMKIQSYSPSRFIIALGLFGLLSSLTANAATANVDIQNFAFSPPTVTINVGDSVIWTQRDTTGHTVTSDNGAFVGSGTLSLGRKYTNTFNTAGSFDYHCIPHSFMTGTVTVQGAANTPPTVSITSPANGTVLLPAAISPSTRRRRTATAPWLQLNFNEGANPLGTAPAAPQLLFGAMWRGPTR